MDNKLKLETFKRLYFGNTEDIEKLAIDRAFLDFARTTKAKNKQNEQERKGTRNKFAEKFKQELLELIKLEEGEKFNEKHSLICKFIINNKDLLKHYETFNYGQAQKWINMTLKYWLLLGILDNKTKIIPLLHVPIDSIVLKTLTNKETFNGKSWSKFNENDYKSCQEECQKLIKEKYQDYNSPVIFLEFQLFNSNI